MTAEVNRTRATLARSTLGFDERDRGGTMGATRLWAATAVVVGVSAASIIVGPYWFDVVYPLVTIWLLLPLLAATRWAIPTRKRGGE